MDQQLRVFAMVVEKGHFSRAAAALYMSQPAVSQHIRSLEKTMGTQLLERTNKQVRMTRAGEIVYAHAKEILTAYSRMQKLVEDLSRQASGPLTIGASYTFGEYVLPRVVAALKQQYPDIAPSVTIGNTSSIVDKLRTGELDVGIVEGHPREMQELNAEELAEDRMVLVAAPDHTLAKWAAQDPHDLEPSSVLTVPEALSAHAWVLRESGSGTREAADDALARLGVVPREILVFSSTQAVKEAVIAGLGISLLSQWAIRRELNSGELQALDVPRLPHTRQFSLVTASTFRTRAMNVFLELLQERRELTGLEP
ncbi:LysR family transcriptional regulator [Saccharibacillus sp. O16]|nr:LysR family transcriptional regulator [Saccharibacillus sp. O16]